MFPRSHLFVWLGFCLLAFSACGQSARGGSAVPRLVAPQIEAAGWGNAVLESVCIQIVQRYPEVDGRIEPVMEAVGWTLDHLSVRTLEPGGECDASLDVRLVGTVLRRDYMMCPGNVCGARYSGDAVLRTAGRPDLVHELDVRRTCPTSINVTIVGDAEDECTRDPADAPFESLWPEAVVGALVEFFGLDAAYIALWDDRYALDVGATIVLRGLGKDAAPLVPRLIADLDPGDRHRFTAAADGLSAIGLEAAGAAPALTVALESSDTTIQLSAIQALMQMGEAALPAVPLLEALAARPSAGLTSQERSVTYWAGLALEGLGVGFESGIPEVPMPGPPAEAPPPSEATEGA
jgi:hypothetical protein